MAIVYNSSSKIDEDSSSASTISWSHTCNALDTKLMAVIGGRATVSGVTYNGIAMTKVYETALMFTYHYQSVWVLDNPTTGSAQNIVASFSSATAYRSGAATGMSGASSGVGANGNGNGFGVATATANVTTTVANSDVLFFGFANTDTAITNGAGQTEIIRSGGAAPINVISYKNTTTTGVYSGTINYGSGTANLAIIGVEVKVSAGFSMVASTGSFSLTGISSNLLYGRVMSAAVGSFALTGIAATLRKGFGFVASAGSFVLTGMDAAFRFSGWSNQGKNAATFSNQSKNSATFSNQSKNSGTWSNQTKN